MDSSTILQNDVCEDLVYKRVSAAPNHAAKGPDASGRVQEQLRPNFRTQLKSRRLNRNSRSTPIHTLSSRHNPFAHHLPHQHVSTEGALDRKDFGGDLSFGDLCDVFPTSALSSGDAVDSTFPSTSFQCNDEALQSGPDHWHARHNTIPSSTKPNASRGSSERALETLRSDHVQEIPNSTESFDPTSYDVQRPRRDCPPLNNAQILSTLDPFIKLPIDINQQERSLIHFYLNFGRRWIWGTSKNPKHCPALDIARSLMHTCPIFVLTNIIIAETILNRMTGRSPQPNYFLRRAQIYKAVNSLLSDMSAPMYLKIYAVMDLAIVEYSNGQIQLQNMHIKALDDLISVKGGLTAYLSRLEDIDVLYVSARFYSSQFIRAEVQISTSQQLDIVIERYFQTLRRIQDWSSLVESQPSYIESVNSHRSQLSYLIDYFSYLIEFWLSENEKPQLSFHNTAGAHFCIFSLAMTLVELNRPRTAIFDFLHQVQTNMLESAEVSYQCGRELSKLHAFAAAHIIAKTRSEILVDRGIESEIRISQAIVDAQKIFVILSTIRRIEIVTRLVDKVFGNPKAGRAGFRDETRFDDRWIAALREELVDSWKGQRSEMGFVITQ